MGIPTSKPFSCMGCDGQSPSRFSLNSSNSQFPQSASQTLFAASMASNSQFDLNEVFGNSDSEGDLHFPELPLPPLSEEETPEPSTQRIRPIESEAKPLADSAYEPPDLYSQEINQILKNKLEASNLETSSITWKCYDSDTKLSYPGDFSGIAIEELLERAESRLTTYSAEGVGSRSIQRKTSLVEYRNKGGKNIVDSVRSQIFEKDGRKQTRTISNIERKIPLINLSLVDTINNRKQKKSQTVIMHGNVKKAVQRR